MVSQNPFGNRDPDEEVERLDLSGIIIGSAIPLEFCVIYPNLKFLDISNNPELENIDNLKYLLNLETLIADNTGVTNILNLPASLVHGSFNNCKITEVPNLPFVMKTLLVQNNPITIMTELPELEFLDARYNFNLQKIKKRTDIRFLVAEPNAQIHFEIIINGEPNMSMEEKINAIENHRNSLLQKLQF